MKDNERMLWEILGLFIKINSKEWGNIVCEKCNNNPEAWVTEKGVEGNVSKIHCSR